MKNIYTYLTKHWIVRFLVSIGIGLVVQICVLYFFTDLVGMPYLYSGLIAFVIGLTIAFIFQKLWAFKGQEQNRFYHQALLYLITGLVSLGINTLFLYFFVDIVGSHYLFAQVLTSLIIAGLSFNLYRTYIFKISTNHEASHNHPKS